MRKPQEELKLARIVKHPAVRRKEIVLAAKTLFLKKDYNSTSMTDIMDMLSIAKGTIYHYFTSKDELLNAVIEQITDDHIAMLKKITKNHKGSALESLGAIIKAERLSDIKTKLLDGLHRPGNIELHSRLLGTSIKKLAPVYAFYISKGCEEQIFDVKHPLETAEYILAGMQYITDAGCYPWSIESLRRRQNAIADLIENTLNAPMGSFDFMLPTQYTFDTV